MAVIKNVIINFQFLTSKPPSFLLAFHNTIINVGLVIIKDTYVWLKYQSWKFTFMSSGPAATTRLGLIPHGMFQLSKSTSWPSSIQESKILWYRGVLHRLLTALLVFHKKMHLNCFSICDPMRQILLLPVWLANACVITLYPADLFQQVLLIKSTCIQNVWQFVWRILTD